MLGFASSVYKAITFLYRPLPSCKKNKSSNGLHWPGLLYSFSLCVFFFFFIRFIFQFISCIPFLIENNEFICSKKKKKKRKKVSFELNIERIKKKRNIRTVKMLLLTAGRTRQGVSGRAEGMRGSKMPEIHL